MFFWNNNKSKIKKKDKPSKNGRNRKLILILIIYIGFFYLLPIKIWTRTQESIQCFWLRQRLIFGNKFKIIVQKVCGLFHFILVNMLARQMFLQARNLLEELIYVRGANIAQAFMQCLKLLDASEYKPALFESASRTSTRVLRTFSLWVIAIKKKKLNYQIHYQLFLYCVIVIIIWSNWVKKCNFQLLITNC